jgi:hypothetical protein
MHAGQPVAESLVECLVSYSRDLSALIAGSGNAWSRGSWERKDAELRKIITRLYGATDELLRLEGAIVEPHAGRIRLLLHTPPRSLTLDLAIEVFDALDRILIEIGDERFVCEEIHGELQWAKGSTTWRTWSGTFGANVPAAVKTYQSGKAVPHEELEAARNELGAFRRARSDDYQVHRSRQRMRARNLHYLAWLLGVMVPIIGWLLASIDQVEETAGEVVLIGAMGALGAAISGTITARDRLVRGSDLRAFHAGLVAQILMGAGIAFVILLLLKSSLLQIAGVTSLEGRAVVGFVAGFSEPFFLKTIERVAKLGTEPQADTGTPPRSGATA